MSLPALEGYRVLRPIGVGGMAELFLAERDGASGARRRVVCKRILPAYARDRHFRELFAHEARIAMQLSHANIVQVYDFLERDETYVLEMEFVDGCDLRRLLAEGGPLPLAPALHVAAEILRGLDYAHRRLSASGTPLDIVHRDVSPGNILLSREGEVKLTDFGLARSRERLGQSVAGVKGTFAFMAPEQAEGRPVDARADQFAVGAVLYAMLSGRAPFEGDGPIATLDRVRAAIYPPLVIDEARELDAILRRALARAAEDRFGSALEMRVAIDALIETRALRSGRDELIARIGALAPDPAPSQGPSSPALVSISATAPPPLRVGAGTQPVAFVPRPPRRRWWISLVSMALLASGLLAWRAGRRMPAAPGSSAHPTTRSPSRAASPSTQEAVTPPAAAPVASAAAPVASAAAPADRSILPRKPAYLTVSADPWAYVSIDGRRRGTTPLRELAIPPGAHEVMLENPALNVQRAKWIKLSSGEHRTLIETLIGPGAREP